MKRYTLIPTLLATAVMAATAHGQADKDGDGKLSIEEARQALPEQLQIDVKLEDKNGDGILSRKEARDAIPNVEFSSQGNPEDPIGEKEYDEIVDTIMGRNQQQSGGQQASSQGGQQSGGQGGQQQAPMFSQADKDGNGELSAEEAREALPDTVVLIDTNDDGVLNRSEAQTALPEVSFSSQGSEQDPVKEQEYQQMVDALQER